MECANNKSNQKIKLLVDTGANKNLIKPGLLQNCNTTSETLIKNITGFHKINKKGKHNLLGRGIPTQTYYEMNFHDFFDGLLGSEFLAKTNSEINYLKGTVTISGIEAPFKRFYPKNLKTYNHIITLSTENNGDWFVPNYSNLTDNVSLCPGLYRASGNKTTLLVQTSSRDPPKFTSNKLNLQVNNFETLSPISMNSNDDLTPEVINNLIRTDHLSKYERDQLLQLILKHQNTLLRADEKLTSTTAIKHKIITTNEQPIYTKSYRYPHSFKNDVEEQIKDMLEHGIIQHSISPYSSPVWVVPKKMDASGKRRMIKPPRSR